MRDLSASDLLEIWERGAGGTPVEQALVILAAAYPQASRGDLARLTIAQRDALLFHLRERTFGAQLKGLAGCPGCQERLELAFDSGDLRVQGLLPEEDALLPAAAGEAPSPGPMSCRAGGFQVTYRLPTSADLMMVHAQAEPAKAHRALLDACIISVGRQGKPVSLDEIPARALRAIVERIGKAAALADLTVAATCPACGHQWEIIFDIVSYFWSEIAAWAARMLNEIHLLASAYGWREADILAMSAWRRQRYLELMGA